MSVVDNPDLNQYEVPLARAERTAMEWAEEARTLREAIPADVLVVESGQEALAALRRVVAAQDRVDALQSKARALMGRTRRARDTLQAEADEQVDAEHVAQSAKRMEYQSSADRQAAAKLAAVEQRRNARLLGRALDTTKEAYEAITAYHWQLNSLREDLRATLNVFRFENSLDR